ncbi:MAG: pyridoxal phosphate-dependent aminotransferase [Muribaculaceae bacterium]|nr:pyridoxal phosphate-dependent aminotransferase [Muribaculaceae bacterium]
MKYNFDEITQRRGTGSYKWDSVPSDDVLPLWVADMDFRTAPAVTEALYNRVSQGIFGYTKVSDDYYQAVIDWFGSRHGLEIRREWIIYTSGVVPALSAIIKALAAPGEKVLVQTPVYNCFFSSIRNNGCIVEECPLVFDGQGYTMDFEGLERCCADPAVKLMLLCNPHNPCGRVWTRDELRLVADICGRHGVRVVSDEIHCELVYHPHRYVPFATVCPEAITCVSPSKAFNIAGLQIANIICADEYSRRLIDRAININEVCDVNPFGVEATIAAYRHGAGWLDALNVYLWENYLALCDFFDRNLPGLTVCRLEGTYLVWVDCRKTGMKSSDMEEYLMEKAGVWLNSGDMYGKAGEGFMRINIACPRERLMEALQRLRILAELV